MPDNFRTRFLKAWNVFRANEETEQFRRPNLGPGYGYRVDRLSTIVSNERSMINAVYNRIGIDVSAVSIKHVRVDENDRFLEVIDSGLNNCLNLEANIDQSGRAFIQDVVQSLCDEGSVAIVPTDTSLNPQVAGSYDILTLRTGKILQWHPEDVQVDLYDQRSGMRKVLTLPKRLVAVVENPLYAVMNQPNSTLKRLIDKINLLDVIDKQSGSGKLDIIVQLPYTIKTEKRKQQAENRRADIEEQLLGSKYGIAYVDGTEKITQLNRPAENNLMGQIEFLTRMLWSQLGLTEQVFDGTASDAEMINYYNRTIEPFLAAITDSMKRVFLTKTGRTQGQSIMAIRDPFKFVAPSQLAELADKFTRNEIVTSNEFRGVIGMKPSSDPKADELRNKNLNQQIDKTAAETPMPDQSQPDNPQNGRSSNQDAEF